MSLCQQDMINNTLFGDLKLTVDYWTLTLFRICSGRLLVSGNFAEVSKINDNEYKNVSGNTINDGE
jgi:hypothetical protein